MKNWIVFRCMVLLSLLCFMPACSDETVFPSPSPQAGEGTVTFKLPFSQKGVISYAIARESENALSDLTIYMFNDDSKTLEKVFRSKDITLGGTGGMRTAKIDVTGKSGKKLFYFAGNAIGRSTDLENLNVGVTTLAEFVEAISLQQTDTLSTPLLMSGKTLISDITRPANVPAELEIKLRRRVARIDILNNDTTNFDIKKVLISNAPQRGYVFADATGLPAKTIEKGSYAPIVITPKDPTNPAPTDSIFYLYPGTMGTGAEELSISFEGVFDKQQTKIYNIIPASPVLIEANKRYILRVEKVDAKGIIAFIEVVDWEESIDVPDLEPGSDLVDFGQIDPARDGVQGITTDPIRQDTYNITNVTKGGTLRFTTSSSGNKGTRAEVSYPVGSASSVPGLALKSLQPDIVRTYGAAYTQTYELEIPVQSAPKGTVEMRITLINESNPDQKKVLTFVSN